MDKADEAVAQWLTQKGEKQSDPHPLVCLDCGGWPIDNGAVFVAVVMVRDTERLSAQRATPETRPALF